MMVMMLVMMMGDDDDDDDDEYNDDDGDDNENDNDDDDDNDDGDDTECGSKPSSMEIAVNTRQIDGVGGKKATIHRELLWHKTSRYAMLPWPDECEPVATRSKDQRSKHDVLNKIVNLASFNLSLIS